MLEELAALKSEQLPAGDYPFILMAGERRSYNANQINRLTASANCDPMSKTPFHKYVQVQIEKAVSMA